MRAILGLVLLDVGQYDGARPPVPRAGNAVAACRRVARDLRRASRGDRRNHLRVLAVAGGILRSYTTRCLRSSICVPRAARQGLLARHATASGSRRGAARRSRGARCSTSLRTGSIRRASAGSVTSFAPLCERGTDGPHSRATSSPRSRRPWTTSSSSIAGSSFDMLRIAEMEALPCGGLHHCSFSGCRSPLSRSAARGSTLGASVGDVSRRWRRLEQVGEIAASGGVVRHELACGACDARRGLPRAHGRAGERGRMTRLFAAELLKLRTLRSTWGFALVALLLAGLPRPDKSVERKRRIGAIPSSSSGSCSTRLSRPRFSRCFWG